MKKTRRAPQTVPQPTPPQPTTRPTTVHRQAIGLFVNAAYQTVIALEYTDRSVVCLQISMSDGLHVVHMPPHIFDREFRPREVESLEQAARTYAEFTRYLGATDDAITRLRSIIVLTDEEVAMAKARSEERRTQADAAHEKKKKSAEAAAAKQAARAEKSTTSGEKTTAATTAKTAAQAKEKSGTTQSQRFQALIMEGKYTDDEIFAIVQKEFGLDKKKRSYVAWYRNHLKNAGKNPPAEKTKK